MKITVTGSLDDLAIVLEKLRSIESEEYSEDVEPESSAINNKLKVRLKGIRNILNEAHNNQVVLTSTESADICYFIDTFLD